MAAPKGNQFYKIRSKDGRDTTYSPQELLLKADEYFQYVINNPFKVQEVVKMRDHFEYAEVEKMRPFTLTGMCMFMEISEETFRKYQKRKEFIGVTTHIRQVIDTQQFDGASSGLFNASIIARRLGLVDKTENKHDVDVKTITGMVINKE